MAIDSARDEIARMVLIVDDEANLRSSLAEFLSLDGYQSEVAASGAEALDLLERRVFDAVVLDLRMPGMDGLETLDRILSSGPTVPVIMMSAHGEISDAVSAMKRGAVDYLVKPFDPAELSLRLGKAIADARVVRRAEAGARRADRPWVGEDPAMRAIETLVARVAPTATTVLITGESGTGKEVFAREIHRLSPRTDGPFVAVNVAALPESLLESELFGYEKGAFTGAVARRAGLFELASGGTLFLDEVGEMSPATQVKLLRVLQERTVTRVGGERTIPVDARIVAATNRDLEADVKTGRFREDLYFRLNVIRLRVPPLRERPGDIAPLAGAFLARFAREIGKDVRGIEPAALRALEAHPFPGNVRELENAVERAVILCDGDALAARDFWPESGSKATAVGDEPVTVREAERRAIVAALARNGGHRERTALELGISRRTLLTKMREYGL